MTRLRRLLKWAGLILGLVLALVLLAAIIGGLWLRGRLEASLPQLAGDLPLAGLSAPVVIERDGLGVATIRAANRLDVARATGFLHAQERFFQMDLLRRSAAGELAALAGRAMLSIDRRRRIHGFRRLAQDIAGTLAEEDRAVLLAYTEGANAGLTTLGARPPEYLALRVAPEPWLPEDTVLVVLAMYVELQGGTGRRESELGLMHDLLPPPLEEFLTPRGTEWDAPISGGPLATPPVPAAEQFDLRRREPAPLPGRRAPGALDEGPPAPGSNNWAVAGSHTASGVALLANDMHLRLSLPNIWYRASFVWPDEETREEHRVTGVTLPGAPPIVAGSNGRVAWGFTNSQGDWSDLVVLDLDPGDSSRYLTPDGPRPLAHRTEHIAIKGEPEEILEVLSTIWGPVIDRDHRGRPRVLRWVAHDREAVNLGLLRMERASGLDEALDSANRTRIPTQNCVVADREGRIGWTWMGPLPRRVGFDGRLPVSWADGTHRWEGWIAPADYARIVDPPQGRIWTANNRVLGGADLGQVEDGGFDLGARAGQIRDDLLALERATPGNMLAIQLDDRALFLARWRDLLLGALGPQALAADPRRAELRRQVEQGWTGRASLDSTGYYLVRSFRLVLAEQVFGALTAPCQAAEDGFSYLRLAQWEGPLWRLVSERPANMLDPRHASWDDQMLAAVDATVALLLRREQGVESAPSTWGERNVLRMRHPLSAAVPRLSGWLDLPPQPLPGDRDMPRVQGPVFGASERMVVSPGREEEGIFHMPGGQSGHPLSPYYYRGHEAWARGEPTPFLPGLPVHRLTLSPAGSRRCSCGRGALDWPPARGLAWRPCAMEYRRLGRSGLKLSALSYGSWVTFGYQLDVNGAAKCMKIAYDLGVNFFDNAEVYADGKSEQIMGEVLRKLGWNRDSYCVSSKVYWGGDLPTQRGLSRKHVHEACHASLRRMQVDYLDLFFCHRPDLETPVEETVRAMHDLIQQGKVLYWGTSEWTAQQIQEAYGLARQYGLTPPTMEQPQYNMLHRERVEREHLRLYSEIGLGLTVWSPLASGVLSGKYRERVPVGSRMALADMAWLRQRIESAEGRAQISKAQELEPIARDLGLTLAQLAIAWCLKNPHVSSVILGASKPTQLQENLHALNRVALLTDEVMERIEQVLHNKPAMPVEW